MWLSQVESSVSIKCQSNNACYFSDCSEYGVSSVTGFNPIPTVLAERLVNYSWEVI